MLFFLQERKSKVWMANESFETVLQEEKPLNADTNHLLSSAGWELVHEQADHALQWPLVCNSLLHCWQYKEKELTSTGVAKRMCLEDAFLQRADHILAGLRGIKLANIERKRARLFDVIWIALYIVPPPNCRT